MGQNATSDESNKPQRLGRACPCLCLNLGVWLTRCSVSWPDDEANKNSGHSSQFLPIVINLS